MPRYIIHQKEIIYENFDGERVLLNLLKGTYYTLSSTGNLIWSWIEEGFSSEEIIEAVGPHASEEIDLFFSSLLQEGLILLATKQNRVSSVDTVLPQGPSSSADLFASMQSKSIPWTPPILTIYEDMKELLLVDPIHEVDQIGWPHR